MKQRGLEGFGERLRRLREARGLTQIELGEVIGVSNRVIHYYEHETAQPPGSILLELASTLDVSLDELLGLRTARERLPSKRRGRLLKRLQRIEELPSHEQKAVLKYLDALLKNRSESEKPEHDNSGNRKRSKKKKLEKKTAKRLTAPVG